MVGTLLLALAAAVAGPVPGDSDAALARFRAVDWESRVRMQRLGPDDSAWRTRVQVEQSLVALGGKAVPGLVAATRDENRHVRALACQVLGLIADGSARKAIEERLTRDPDKITRLYAAEALGRLGDAAALPALRAASNDANANVANAARWAAQRLEQRWNLPHGLAGAMHPLDTAQMAPPAVGTAAPDFTLPQGDGKPVALRDLLGKQDVVLLFQVADW